MPVSRLLVACGALVLGVAGILAAAAPASGQVSGSPDHRSEGPAGPPAVLPDGHVAAPPTASPQGDSAGCGPAAYGANFYAPSSGSGRTVALTFDDGPGPTTPRIIAVLHDYGVPATFFNIGQNAAAYPALLRTEATDGYLVGNHTWNHPDMPTLSASAQAAEMDEATVEQQALIGWGPCAFRPPYGNYNSTTLTLAQQRGMKVWLWSVDTEDWKAAGSSSAYWVDRIIRLAESEGGGQRHPVILMHNAPSGDPATVLALPAIITYFRDHGYTFVSLTGSTGHGYQILTSGGAVRGFGAAGYGQAKGAMAAGLAVDPDTGGYWILRPGGGVLNFHAPWYGSLAGELRKGVKAIAIAASRGGYLVLTSDGAVHAFGAPWHGSVSLGRATAVGLAADLATGGYWILEADGGVVNVDAPWYGSLAGKLTGTERATAIAASPGGGYLLLTSAGTVAGFHADTYGSARRTLGRGGTAVGLAIAPATGGYWILMSDGGVLNFHAPWQGSLAGRIPARQAVTAIAGV